MLFLQHCQVSWCQALSHLIHNASVRAIRSHVRDNTFLSLRWHNSRCAVNLSDSTWRTEASLLKYFVKKTKNKKRLSKISEVKISTASSREEGKSAVGWSTSGRGRGYHRGAGRTPQTERFKERAYKYSSGPKGTEGGSLMYSLPWFNQQFLIAVIFQQRTGSWQRSTNLLNGFVNRFKLPTVRM